MLNFRLSALPQIALLLLAFISSARASDNSAVYLRGTSDFQQSAHGGLLGRELFRQAILIAAREGLGLPTRDQSLREWRGEPPVEQTLQCDFLNNQITLRRAGDANPTVLWQRKLPDHWCRRLPDMLEKIERDSRGDYIRALRSAGLDGHAKEADPQGPSPDGAEALVGQLDELSQFAALRLAHAAIAAGGESPARLSILVRAYANLGQLTQYYWDGQYAVFTARSILYAQRMVAADPKSAFALWHRAYAFAMAGFNSSALEDIAAATAAAKNAPPAWAVLLEPFCHYQAGRLIDLAANPELARLAPLMAYLTMKNSGSQGAIMNFAGAALTVNPDCLFLMDDMCDQTGPGMLNELTESGPQVFSKLLGDRLEQTPHMPQSIIDRIQSLRRGEGNPAGREIICQALIDQAAAGGGDANEPSLAVLGRMIQETTFAQVNRRSHLIAMGWGTDASGYVAEVGPLVADHPFKGLIEVYGLYNGGDVAAINRALATCPRERMTLSALPLYYLVLALQDKAAALDLMQDILWNMDITSGQLDRVLYLYAAAPHEEFTDDTVAMLSHVAPDSPLLIARAVLDHWDADKAKAWETQQGDHPTVALALGQKYTELKQWADAIRNLKQRVAVSPDEAGYKALAEVYRQQHQMDLWLLTLNDYLQKPDYGLQHAEVDVLIANYYMDNGQFNDALPYAQDASGTASAWGIECEAAARAGLGDWDAAEKLIQEEIEHYSISPYQWYAWTIRTGHGNRAAAAAALAAYCAQRGQRFNDDNRLELVILAMAEQHPNDAMPVFQERMRLKPGPISALHIAMLADAAKDFKTRDDALKQAIEHAPGNNPPLGELATLFIQAIAAGPDTPIDPAAIDKIAKKAEPVYAITVYYCMACYLENRGHPEQATDYLRDCLGLTTNEQHDWFEMIIVDAALRQRNMDPLDLERGVRPNHQVSLYP